MSNSSYSTTPKAAFNSKAAFIALTEKNYVDLELQLDCETSRLSKNDRGLFHYFSARMFERNGQFDRSVSELTKSSCIFQKIGNKLWSSRCELRLALDFVIRRMFSEAEAHFTTAISILGDEDSFETLAALAIAYHDYSASLVKYNGSFELAYLYARKAVEHSTLIGMPLPVVNSCSNAVLIAYKSGSVLQGSFFAELGSKYAKQLLSHDNDVHENDVALHPDGIVRIQTPIFDDILKFFMNNGNLRLDLGQTDQALESYTHALDLSREHWDGRVQAAIANQVAKVHILHSNFVLADYLLTEAIEYYEKNEITNHNLIILQGNLAEIKTKQANYSEALALYCLIRDRYSPFDDPIDEAHLLHSLGDVYYHLGEFDNAIEYAEKALKLSQHLGIHNLVICCFRLLGMSLMQSNTEMAQEYLTKSLILANDQGNTIEARDVYFELSRYYKLTGNLAEALMNYEKYIALKDEISNRNVQERIARLSVLHETEKIKAQVASMELQLGQVSAKLAVTSVSLNEKVLEIQQLSKELQFILTKYSSKHEIVDHVEKGITHILLNQSEEKDASLRELLRYIKSYRGTVESMDDFGELFIKANDEFMHKLSGLAPDITATELKVCVLINMSLPTKNIAQMLKSTGRTIENHRTSIRKKLGLPHEKSLSNFLISLR